MRITLKTVVEHLAFDKLLIQSQRAPTGQTKKNGRRQAKKTVVT